MTGQQLLLAITGAVTTAGAVTSWAAGDVTTAVPLSVIPVVVLTVARVTARAPVTARRPVTSPSPRPSARHVSPSRPPVTRSTR